jgi:aminoglycoside phosphotransferase (APT) family kinase protein
MASHSRVPDVRGVVAAHLPGYRVDSVVRLGAGTDNVAYEVNGELVVRFSRAPDSGAPDSGEPDPERVTNEARLLVAVAEVSPLAVPVPAFTDPERGCLAYRKLPGRPLLDLRRHGRSDQEESVAATLGEFLAALHAVPVDRVAHLVQPDDQPLPDWRREAAESYLAIAGQVPVAHRRAVEAFLEAPPPEGGYAPVFSHNDLGIEHVLVDPRTWTVTGVIDWSDAAIVDPACDFGLLYRDLGPAALRTATSHYHTGADLAGLRDRAAFYARCGVLEDLAYGLAPGRDAYADKSLAAMSWLFPA